MIRIHDKVQEILFSSLLGCLVVSLYRLLENDKNTRPKTRRKEKKNHAILLCVSPLLFLPSMEASSSSLCLAPSPPRCTSFSISRNEITTVSVEPSGVSIFSNEGISCSCRWLECALFAPLPPTGDEGLVGNANIMLLRGCRAAAAIPPMCFDICFLILSWSSNMLGAALAKSGRMGGMEMQTMLMVHSSTLHTSGSAMESGASLLAVCLFCLISCIWYCLSRLWVGGCKQVRRHLQVMSVPSGETSYRPESLIRLATAALFMCKDSSVTAGPRDMS